MRPVRPNAEAEREIRDAIRWYEHESAGLGDRLWFEIQAAVELIAAHPGAGQAVRGSRRTVRRLPLRHFPFLLVYRQHPGHLEIVALSHTSRKPDHWRRRAR